MRILLSLAFLPLVKANDLYSGNCQAPSSCTDAVLSSIASTHSCAARITYLMQEPQSQEEREACSNVASEFQAICGPCLPDGATFAPTPEPMEGGVLVWQEEFSGSNGAKPDSGTWSYDIGNGSQGWGNFESQEYSSSTQNVQTKDGNLVITVREETDGHYTSGRIRTERKMEFMYGSVEAKIKSPSVANGLWPAFWLLGSNFRTAGWPACGELDILELGSAEAIRDGMANRRAGSAAHWEVNNQYASYFKSFDSPTDLSAGFHVYRMDWTPDTVTTFVDGNFIWEFDISQSTCSDCDEFHQPFFFITNVAVGGTYTGVMRVDGQPITANLPASLEIDYIRLYDHGHTILSGTSINGHGFDCGMPESCTQDVLDTLVGDETCGTMISQYMLQQGLDEFQACAVVAETEGACSPCTPDPNAPPPAAPTPPPPAPGAPPPTPAPPAEQLSCNAPTCTAEVWYADAYGHSCGDRITWLMETENYNMVDACLRVATETDTAPICSSCNPFNPAPSPTPPPPTPRGGFKPRLDCGVATCTEDVWTTNANGHECGERIYFLMDTYGKSQTDACAQVATEADTMGLCARCHPHNPMMQAPPITTTLASSSNWQNYNFDCGAPDICNQNVLNRLADGFSCGDRIQHLVAVEGESRDEACRRVAGDEYPRECGPCIKNVIDCGSTCTDSVLDSMTDGGHRCRDRIAHVVSEGKSELEACAQVAKEASNAQACGACNPV